MLYSALIMAYLHPHYEREATVFYLYDMFAIQWWLSENISLQKEVTNHRGGEVVH